MENGIADETSPWDRLKGQMFFGSEDFICSMKASKIKDETIKEVPKAQRYADRIRLEDLFDDIKDKQERNEKVRMAYVQYGYKMKEIADYLSIHYTTVSKIINPKK